MSLDALNNLSTSEAEIAFTQCCSANRWVEQMVAAMPFNSIDTVQLAAIRIWETMNETDFLEAFDGHPKIGDPDSLKKKYQTTHSLATSEQSSVEHASDDVLGELARYNRDYENKFGFIFIVCATGKSAPQMLEFIHSRIQNDREQEILIAAAEQAKITAIRIDKLFDN